MSRFEQMIISHPEGVKVYITKEGIILESTLFCVPMSRGKQRGNDKDGKIYNLFSRGADFVSHFLKSIFNRRS